MKDIYHKKKSLGIALRRLIASGKETPVFQYVGCKNVNEFRTKLTLRFTEGMTFENYKVLWNIDHIVPQVLFDITKDEELLLCYNWRNLLPMLKRDNHVKEHCPIIAYNLIEVMPNSEYKSSYIKRLEPIIQLYEKYIKILKE